VLLLAHVDFLWARVRAARSKIFMYWGLREKKYQRAENAEKENMWSGEWLTD
jgi:hypothetical protein